VPIASRRPRATSAPTKRRDEAAIVDLTEDSVVVEARAVSGLQDFGDESFREAMRRLLAALDREAQLTPMGRAVQRQRIVDLLVNRLRAEACFARNPEIAKEDIRAPIVIVGLPRTGTTLLHRTIASDPRLHAARWYECRFPAPLDDAAGEDPRIARAEAEVRAMLEGVPALRSIHPLEATAPDEEILLLEHSFYSTTPEGTVNVPSYGEWLSRQDHRPAYRYLRRLLQLIQWQQRRAGSRAQRWVLKTPHHLAYADLVLEEFPDSLLVQTHRDPLESIPSLASFIHALWSLVSERVDAKEIGRQWNAKMAHALAHCLAVRDRYPDRFVDVWFRDAVQDPVGQTRRIYAAARMQMTPDAEAAMRGFLATNPREGRPPHVYTLEEFGLTRAGIERDFAAYRERFILGRERGD
jgi:hypothetical protein